MFINYSRFDTSMVQNHGFSFNSTTNVILIQPIYLLLYIPSESSFYFLTEGVWYIYKQGKEKTFKHLVLSFRKRSSDRSHYMVLLVDPNYSCKPYGLWLKKPSDVRSIFAGTILQPQLCDPFMQKNNYNCISFRSPSGSQLRSQFFSRASLLGDGFCRFLVNII